MKISHLPTYVFNYEVKNAGEKNEDNINYKNIVLINSKQTSAKQLAEL